MHRKLIARTNRFATCAVVAAFTVTISASMTGCASPANRSASRGELHDLTWSELPPIPDAHGFAGAYAGMSHGALIVAGGSNFPDAPPWKGGMKSWYGDAYVLQKKAKTWAKVNAALPSARGYGASIAWLDSIICIGGADASRHYADVFKLEWKDGKLIKSNLPSLPMALANIAAARVGTKIFVIGGNDAPTATSASAKFFSLDLGVANALWEELEPLPGEGRILPVTAAVHGSFYVFSGAQLVPNKGSGATRVYLTDGFCFTPGKGWKPIATMPRAVVAAPSPAIATGKNRFAIFGGDDGSMVDFEPKEQHPGFGRDILEYNVESASWNVVGRVPLGQVTTTLVDAGDKFIIPNGEIRPATRTPRVMVATPTKIIR